MKKRIRRGIALLAAASMLLASCGNAVPDMSDEESAQIVEFAAGLLLKYDANYESRLVEDTAIEEEVQEEQESAPASDRTEETAVEEEVQEKQPVLEEQESAQTSDRIEETAVEEKNRSIEEFYGLEGVEIKYAGYELKDLYPDNGEEELYFAMSAVTGCKLLILNFEIVNTGERSAAVDMISADARFKISINGETPRYALTTMLTNDLSSYVGTIEQGAAENLVLVVEIPDEKAESIQTISLSMRNVSEVATSSLK